MTQMSEWAVAYAKNLGFPVFPCRSLRKAPATEHGFKDATTDIAQIQKWWDKEPTLNIGIPIPSGMVVVDVDSEDARNQLAAHDLELPATVAAKTPRGWHYWYKGDGFGPAVDVFPGVDIRGPGSYVVVPPSERTRGRKYQWEVPPKNGNMSEAPDWLYDSYQSRSQRAEGQNGASKGVDPREVLRGVTEGARDVTLFRYACRLRALGYDRSEAEVLVEHAASECTPPFEAKIASRKVEQAWKYDGPKEDEDQIKVWALPELLAQEFPEPFWLIKDLLPESLSIVFSDAKIGKSFLVGKMCVDIANGTWFLGQFETTPSEVLYIDLEQPPRRAKGRWLQVIGKNKIPEQLHTVYDWPRMGEGGVQKLDEYLIDHPRARLIVIDVVSNIWPEQKGSGNAYHWEKRQLERLKKVADKHESAILLVHHTNKSEHGDWLRKSSGSQAMTAVPDTIFILERERNGWEGYLDVTGTDVEERRIEMAFVPRMGGWRDKESARHMKLIGDDNDRSMV